MRHFGSGHVRNFLAKNANLRTEKLSIRTALVSPTNPDSGFAGEHMGRQELMTSAKSHRPVIYFFHEAVLRGPRYVTPVEGVAYHIEHEDRT